jgi:hypothetical protein
MTNPAINVLRLITRDSDYLDRKLGTRGEIFFDQNSNALRLYDGATRGGYTLSKADLSNVENADFLAKAIAAGVGAGGGGNVSVTVSETTPSSPTNGNLWLNTNNGKLYVYVNDGSSSQWIQPSSPTPNLTGIATEEYVDTAIENIPAVDLTGLATETYVNSAITNIQESGYATESYVNQQVSSIEFSIAGDDSTLRSIRPGNTIKFLGASGISITTDENGLVTVTGSPSSSIGNLNIVGNVVDSNDSNSISFTPEVIFSSEVTIQDELVVSNKVTADSFESSSTSVPEFYSATNLNLTAGNAVVVTQSPLRLAQFTTAERDLLTAQNGDIIYNTSLNKFQGYENGSWVSLI